MIVEYNDTKKIISALHREGSKVYEYAKTLEEIKKFAEETYPNSPLTEVLDYLSYHYGETFEDVLFL